MGLFARLFLPPRALVVAVGQNGRFTGFGHGRSFLCIWGSIGKISKIAPKIEPTSKVNPISMSPRLVDITVDVLS